MNKSLGDSALPPQLLQYLYVQGLHDSLHDRVVAQMPSSLEEAVRFATHFEQYAKGKGTNVSPRIAIHADQPVPFNIPQGYSDTNPPRSAREVDVVEAYGVNGVDHLYHQMDSLERLHGVVQDVKRSIQGNGCAHAYMEPPKCYYCGHSGHTTLECYMARHKPQPHGYPEGKCDNRGYPCARYVHIATPVVNAAAGQRYEDRYSNSCSDPHHKSKVCYDLDAYEKRGRDQAGMETPDGKHFAPALRSPSPTSQDCYHSRPVSTAIPSSHQSPPPPVVDAHPEQPLVPRCAPIGVNAPLQHQVAPKSYDGDTWNFQEVECVQDSVMTYLAHAQPPPPAKPLASIDIEDGQLHGDQSIPEQPLAEVPKTPPAIQSLPEEKLKCEVSVADMSPQEILPPGGNDLSFLLTKDIFSESVLQSVFMAQTSSIHMHPTNCYRDILLPVSKVNEGDALSFGCDTVVMENDKSGDWLCPYNTVNARPPPAPTW